MNFTDYLKLNEANNADTTFDELNEFKSTEKSSADADAGGKVTVIGRLKRTINTVMNVNPKSPGIEMTPVSALYLIKWLKNPNIVEKLAENNNGFYCFVASGEDKDYAFDLINDDGKPGIHIYNMKKYDDPQIVTGGMFLPALQKRGIKEIYALTSDKDGGTKMINKLIKRTEDPSENNESQKQIQESSRDFHNFRDARRHRRFNERYVR